MLSRRQSSRASRPPEARYRRHVASSGKSSSPLGVRVEVIVHVHAVDVVAPHHVAHGRDQLALRVGFTRIEPQLRAVRAHELGPPRRDMRRRQRGDRGGVPRAERIEPGVQLQPARVGRGDRERQRVVRIPRRLSRCAGEVLRPWSVVCRIDRIGRGAHLQEDRVQSQRLRAIEDADQLRLLFRGGEIAPRRPVDVAHGGDPHPANLARRHRPRMRARLQQQRGDECQHVLHLRRSVAASHHPTNPASRHPITVPST